MSTTDRLEPGLSEGRPILRRDLGLMSAAAVGMGAIVGAGVFVVMGVAAGVAGPSFLLGLGLAGFAAVFNALSSAQLAAVYPQSGGTYEYGYRLLNPWLGFSAGWMFLVSKLAAGSVVALGFAGYLTALVPMIPSRPAAITAVLVLTAVNYAGIRNSGRVNMAILSVTVLALLAFVAAGWPAFDPRNLQPFAPGGWGGILESAGLLFFAYTGYARLATLGEEVREPQRTIPKAILLSLGGSMALYVAVALVAVGTIGVAAMAATNTPIEQAARGLGVPGLPTLVTVGAMTAMFGVLLSQQLGISRMMLAMARRRDLPHAIAHIHARHGVPDRAVLLTGAILVAVTILGRLEFILAGAAFTILLYYAVTNLAALRLPPADRLVPRWVALAGLASCLALAFSLRPAVIASGLGLLVVGLVGKGLRRPLAGASGTGATGQDDT